MPDEPNYLFPVGTYSYLSGAPVFGVEAEIQMPPRGVVICLAAMNGAGKSTAMRYIYQKRKSVYLPEEMAFPSHLKPGKVLDLFGGKPCCPEAEQLIRDLGCEDKPFGYLSKGNKQKLRLSVVLRLAFASPAKELMVLLDEPGSGLDSRSLALLKRALQEIAMRRPDRRFVVIAHENWEDVTTAARLTIEDKVLREIKS